MKKNKILITGGGGSLGRTLVDLLDRRQESCLSLVRRRKRNDNSVKCDIRDFDSINGIVSKFKPTHVIHLAGITGNLECEKDPDEAFRTNVYGTFNVLKSCAKIKPKIIFSSSREVYGDSRTRVDEGSTLNPINVNGMTKMMSENLITSHSRLYKIPYSIIRFTNFYGENFSKRGISKMIRTALENRHITVFGGDQQIDLIHFDDAAAGLLKTISGKKSEIYNMGSGRSTTILQLIRELEKYSKIKIKYQKKQPRHFEVMNFKMDISKAKRDLNFQPSVKFRDIIGRISNGQVL